MNVMSYRTSPDSGFLYVNGGIFLADRGRYSLQAGKCVEGKEQMNISLLFLPPSFFTYLLILFLNLLLSFILLLYFQDPFIEYPHQPSTRYTKLSNL